MIRAIAHEVERIEPLPLLHTKYGMIHHNNTILFNFKRLRLPSITSTIAFHYTRIKNEFYLTKHILNRYDATCVCSIILSYLTICIEDL